MTTIQLTYIARAIDGSWISPDPAESEEMARAQIALHEPDPQKQNNYQILVEPISNLLGNRVEGVKAIMRHKLVKWEGDSPVPDDAKDHPEKYPQVAEVVEGGDDIPTKVIYRRS